MESRMRYILKKHYLLRVFLVLSIFQFTIVDVKGQIQMPSVEAQSMLKFGNNDVSPYTGGVDIKIPIYTINSDIAIPIYISYTGGHGIKVSEYASSVGLGWSLQASQVVSKIVKGGHDNSNNGYGGDSSEFYDWDSEYWFEEQMFYDYEPDLNYFSTYRSSGSFYIDKKKHYIQVPLSNVKIEGDFSERGGYITVTETDGSIYKYSSVEQSGSTRLSPSPTIFADYKSSSCYLSKLITPKGALIKYVYNEGDNNNEYIEETYTYHHNTAPVVIRREEGHSVYGYERHMMSTKTKKISEIIWDEGRVKFTYKTGRRDLTGGRYLDRIDIFDTATPSNIIKSFKLHYSYFADDKSISLLEGDSYEFEKEKEGSKLRLKLDRVDVLGSDLLKNHSYNFSYFDDYYLPERSSMQIDHWGYFNGEKNTQLNPHTGAKSAKRQSNENFSKAGVLKMIEYPTGGKTLLELESNVVLDNFEPNYTYSNADSGTIRRISSDMSPDEIEESLYETRRDTIDCTNIKITNSENKTGEIGVLASNYPYQVDDAIFLTLINMETGNRITSRLCHFSKGEEFSVIVQPGVYSIEAYSHIQNLEVRWDLSFSWIDAKFIEDKANNTGGLRLKKITDITEDGNNIVREYIYENDNGLSTGSLVERPRYQYLMDYNEFTFQAPAIFNAENPIFPLRLTKNSVVGYSEVTEITRGNGKIKYYYTDPILFKDSSKVFYKTIGIDSAKIDKHGMVLLEEYGKVPLFPLAEKQSNEIARGHLFKKEFYEEDGDGNYQLIKKSESNYYAYNVWSDLGLQHVNSEPTEPGFDNLTPPQDCGPFILNPIEKVYGDKTKTIKGQKLSHKGNRPYGIDYYINTGLVLKHKTKTTTYLDNGEISSDEQFKFNNIGQIERVIKKEGNKVIETTYHYPNEINHIPLYTKNMISTPYKQITKEDGHYISASDQKYNAQCLPTKSYSFGGINSHGDIDFKEKLNCTKYDEKGHLLSCETSSGMKYCYVWGYNNTKVVAEIIGLDYTQISGEIPSSLDTEESIIYFAEKMRSAIKIKNYTSSITAYTYKPLIGISSKIDNNGLRTFYEYDELGRLCEIKDNNLHVLKSYKYNYKH
jgi:hypothetical protein